MTAGTAIVELNKMIKNVEAQLQEKKDKLPDGVLNSDETWWLDGTLLGYKRALALMNRINK